MSHMSNGVAHLGLGGNTGAELGRACMPVCLCKSVVTKNDRPPSSVPVGLRKTATDPALAQDYCGPSEGRLCNDASAGWGL